MKYNYVKQVKRIQRKTTAITKKQLDLLRQVTTLEESEKRPGIYINVNKSDFPLKTVAAMTQKRTELTIKKTCCKAKSSIALQSEKKGQNSTNNNNE